MILGGLGGLKEMQTLAAVAAHGLHANLDSALASLGITFDVNIDVQTIVIQTSLAELLERNVQTRSWKGDKRTTFSMSK